MPIYGYARTSTIEQVAGLADQIAKLKKAGCSDQSIYQEQISSVKMEDRVEFVKVLAALKSGDVLVFSSLSRAARSMIHMIEIDARPTEGAVARHHPEELPRGREAYSDHLPRTDRSSVHPATAQIGSPTSWSTHRSTALLGRGLRQGIDGKVGSTS